MELKLLLLVLVGLAGLSYADENYCDPNLCDDGQQHTACDHYLVIEE